MAPTLFDDWQASDLPAALLEALPVAVCFLRGEDLRVEWVNRAYQVFAPGKQMIGLTWDELWAETGQDFSGICRQVLETGVPYHAADEANEIRRGPEAALETAYFSWSLHRIKLAGRTHFDLIGTAYETTERTRAVIEAESRANWFRLLFDSNPQPMWVFDLETLHFLEVNSAAIEKYGWSRDEFLAMTIADIRPPEDVPRLKAVTGTAADGLHDAGLWRHRTKHGELLDVHITAHGIEFEGRAAELIVAMDVSARVRAEAALRESEEVNRVTFQHAAVGIAHVGPDGRFIRCNATLAEIVGYSLDELAEMRFQDITHPDDLADDLDSVARLIGGRVSAYAIDKRYIRKDGTIAFVTLTVSLVRHADGSPRFFISVVQDNSQRHQSEMEHERLQEELAQAQKMESIGRLAGGVAHDYNNMLSVILGYTDLALHEVPPDGPVASDLREVQGAAQRSAEITAQLLAFARKQSVSPRTIDLNVTVEGMLKMLRRLIGEDVVLEWQPAADLWPVRMDPSQVHQVLANLCVNARDAIAGQGRIVIQTRNVVVDETFAGARRELPPGEYVGIRVTDSGSGMSPEVAARAFEPFFTTKAAGKGTGLGLSMVFGIAKQNRGAVEAESAIGKGTAISLLLPRDVSGAVSAASTGARSAVPQGTETILLLEDEPAVLRIEAEMLSRLGYVVLSAMTPAEAHLHLTRSGPRPRLLITDIVMPERNGPELAAELCARVPDLRVLYVSGYPGNILEERGVHLDAKSLLPKPFTLNELAARVREILDD